MILKIKIMNEISEIKIPKGVESISVKQHDDRIVIEFIPEKPKFKRGDILISIVTPGLTVIFDKPTSTTAFDSIYHNGDSSNHGWSLECFRHATKEEEQKFFDELEAQGKWWNAEKLIVEAIPQPKFKVGDEVRIKKGISSKTHRYIGATFLDEMDKFIGQKLVVSTIWELPDRGYVYRVNNSIYDISEDWIEFYTEEPKKGDLAIFWDYGKDDAIIRHYDKKDYGYHRDSSGVPWDNAVKWDGTKEQFEKVLRGEIG